jgi:putative transcriptional regulator
MTEGIEAFSLGAEDPAPGRLLVASAVLLDPNFASTVVLLLDHDEDGSLGVVLNRPTPVAVQSVLPDWGSSVVEPQVLFQGGPVGRDSALAVASVEEARGSEPVGFRRLFGDTGIVDLDTPPEVLAPAMTRMRVFAGYAGWGAGQLHLEIQEGSWYVVDSRAEDIFGADPARLWHVVLRRQPGELAWLSTRPEDPTLN